MINFVENFLTEDECKELIALATPHLRQSKVATPENIHEDMLEFRNSQDYYVKEDNPLTMAIKLRVQETLGVPVSHMEHLCIICYDEGEFFGAHHDFFHDTFDSYDECVKHGGNRNLTCIFYLQQAEQGGQTNFPLLERTFVAEPGTLIHWKNMVDGHVILETLHEGLPVIKGRKWVASIWCRERPFDPKALYSNDGTPSNSHY